MREGRGLEIERFVKECGGGTGCVIVWGGRGGEQRWRWKRFHRQRGWFEILEAATSRCGRRIVGPVPRLVYHKDEKQNPGQVDVSARWNPVKT